MNALGLALNQKDYVKMNTDIISILDEDPRLIHEINIIDREERTPLEQLIANNADNSYLRFKPSGFFNRYKTFEMVLQTLKSRGANARSVRPRFREKLCNPRKNNAYYNITDKNILSSIKKVIGIDCSIKNINNHYTKQNANRIQSLFKDQRIKPFTLIGKPAPTSAYTPDQFYKYNPMLKRSLPTTRSDIFRENPLLRPPTHRTDFLYSPAAGGKHTKRRKTHRKYKRTHKRRQ
jgi:hypothetical protein